MNITKIFAVLLVFATVSFANLGFKEGDNEFGTGFLAGWGYGDGYGVPFVWDRGAFGGMFSFGGELRMWWTNYWGWVDGYSVYDEDNNHVYPWWVDGYRKKLTRFGWAPMFRFMYHPFGMPTLKGQVKVAKSLDPYVGMKFGFSVINYSKDDQYYNVPGRDRRYVDFPVFNLVWGGLRWYFTENVSLWSEASIYDFSLGLNFKF